MTDNVILAFSSCPGEACGHPIAESLVIERSATRVSRVTGMTSTYVWNERLQNEPEVLLLIKTVASKLPALTTRLTELHPYELPELGAIPVSGGNEPYLAWVRQGVM